MFNRHGSIFAAVACFLLLVGLPAKASAKEPITAHEQLDAALWVQTSAEFYACAKQAFAGAKAHLPLALRDPMWTASTEQFEAGGYEKLPPAVIVNLDETVWSNSGYQSRIILEYGQHDGRKFVDWANEAKCSIIPGARDFLREAKRLGVAIIYITPRPTMTRDGTLRNLRRLDLPYNPGVDELLMSGPWPDTYKREIVGKEHRILLIVSDHLGDFLHNSGKGGPETRRELAARASRYWGLKWFIVPNPMYGHWEYSLQGFDYSLNRKTRVENKLHALQSVPES